MTSTSVRPSYNQSARDPGTAAMMSLLLPGLGQMYNGETRKGMLFMCVSFLNFVLFLALVFNQPILNALLEFGKLYHMKPNRMLVGSLLSAGLFSPVGLILVGFFLAWIAYAVRDAYDHAALRRRRIYPDFVIELPEATSGSYIFHFSVMVALFIIAFFFIIPPMPKSQVTDIEFVQNQIETRQRVRSRRRSEKNTKSSGQRDPRKPVQAPQSSGAKSPNTPAKQPSQSKAPQQQQQQAQSAPKAPAQRPSPSPAPPTPSPRPSQAPQARPAPTPSPSPTPSPAPAPMPRMAPSPSPSPSPAMPRLNSPSPSPMPRLTPSPMAMPSATPLPMAGMPKSFNAPSPMPSLAPSRLAAPGASIGTPTPMARPSGGVPSGLPNLAPSPVGLASNAGLPGFAPSPRSSLGGGGGSQNYAGGGAPAPVKATSGGGGGGGSGSGAAGGPNPVPVASGGGGGGSRSASGGGPGGAPAPTRAGRGGGGSGGGGYQSGPVAILPSVRPGGGGGGPGSGSGDSPGNPDGNTKGPGSVGSQKDVDFGPYMADLQRRIKRHWFPPRGQENRRVVVVFKIHTHGELSNLRIERSSGMDSADQAALAAVQNAAPFRPLPDGAPSVVDIQFTFDYNVFTGGGSGSFRRF